MNEPRGERAPDAATIDRTREALERRLHQDVRLWMPLLIAGTAGAVALMAPFVVVPLVIVGAAHVIATAGDRIRLRNTTWLALSVFAATVLLQPLVLRASGVDWTSAFMTGLLVSIRLGAVLFVAGALQAWVRPADWSQGLRRFPRVAFVTMLTLRLVPEFAAMHRRVRRAQQARGLTSWRHRMRGVVTSFVLVLEKAERMARSS